MRLLASLLLAAAVLPTMAEDRLKRDQLLAPCGVDESDELVVVYLQGTHTEVVGSSHQTVVRTNDQLDDVLQKYDVKPGTALHCHFRATYIELASEGYVSEIRVYRLGERKPSRALQAIRQLWNAPPSDLDIEWLETGTLQGCVRECAVELPDFAQ